MKKNMATKKLCGMTIGALILVLAALAMGHTEIAENVSAYGNFKGFALAFTIASMGLNILYFLGVFDKIADRKKTKRA